MRRKVASSHFFEVDMEFYLLVLYNFAIQSSFTNHTIIKNYDLHDKEKGQPLDACRHPDHLRFFCVHIMLVG